jgi:hypothetical protein
MGHGAMVQQSVGPGNRPREWDDVEVEAHRRRDSMVDLRWGRLGSSGSGRSSEL